MSLSRTSSEFAGIIVHAGWLIIEVPFWKAKQKKKPLSITQCSHGKTEAPLFFLLLKAMKDPSAKGR